MKFCLTVLLICIPTFSQEKGFIHIDSDYPHTFIYDNGDRYFPMGETCYFLLASDMNTIQNYIDSRRSVGFNFIRIGAGIDENWPLGGTPSSPDFMNINETAMQKLDAVFDYAAGEGMNIELILWVYGNICGNWGNESYENFWVDAVVQRYNSRQNLFMWTVVNEFERYPDDNYSYSSDDVEWGKRIAARIKSNDANNHPVGVHPSHWIQHYDDNYTYNGFTTRAPQVVWPLWENSSADLFITQNNEGVHPQRWEGRNEYDPITWQGIYYPVEWTSTGWDFEGAGMEDAIAEDWSHGKPVLNTEFGYQYETGCEDGAIFTTQQAHQPSSIRKKAWKIVTAGGFFAAGFAHSWNYVNDINNWRPEQLEILHDFFTTKTEYWKLAPQLELVADKNVCLADPGNEYIIYFPQGGTNDVELQAGNYEVEWLNPRTGSYTTSETIESTGGNENFDPPGETSEDWVLYLKEEIPQSSRKTKNISSERKELVIYSSPFHPPGRINYRVAGGAEKTELVIMDAHARRVRSLVNLRQSAGSYSVFWDGRDDKEKRMKAGIYFIRLSKGIFLQVQKLCTIK
jgi:hypothetical protein